MKQQKISKSSILFNSNNSNKTLNMNRYDYTIEHTEPSPVWTSSRRTSGDSSARTQSSCWITYPTVTAALLTSTCAKSTGILTSKRTSSALADSFWRTIQALYLKPEKTSPGILSPFITTKNTRVYKFPWTIKESIRMKLFHSFSTTYETSTSHLTECSISNNFNSLSPVFAVLCCT